MQSRDNSGCIYRSQITAASADVLGSRDYPQVRGKVRFTQTTEGVAVEADIHGLPETPSGFFAFHLHEGVCAGRETEEGAAFPESGGHYNPGEQMHPRHAGDFPPLLRLDAGRARLSFLTDRFTLKQAVGRAVVIHLNPDDFRSQPSGDSGPKIACGDVRLVRRFDRNVLLK